MIDWSQIGSAPIFERGVFFAPGRYKLRLTRCLSKQTQKSGVAFIAEFDVLESDNPAHPIGSKGTFFVKMAQQQIAFSNIKELIAAVLGFDITNPEHKQQLEEQVSPQLARIMTALETQGVHVLGGRETVAVECRIKLTQRGTEFTLHTWTPWTPAPGWQPVPTPATAQMPQRVAAAYAPPAYAPPAAAPGAYAPPAAYAPPGAAPPAYAPPAYAPPGAAPPGAAPAAYAPPGAAPAAYAPPGAYAWPSPK